MQVNTEALKQAASNAEDGEAGSRYARFDQACLELFQMGRVGKLPGAFFGRVCNIARVVDMDSAAAANAVAKEAVNLVSCCWAYILYPVDAPILTFHSISSSVAHLLLGKAKYGVPRRFWCSDSLSSLSLHAWLSAGIIYGNNALGIIQRHACSIILQMSSCRCHPADASEILLTDDSCLRVAAIRAEHCICVVVRRQQLLWWTIERVLSKS